MHIYSNHGILEITGDTCGGAFGCCGPFNAKFKCFVQRQQTFEEPVSLLRDILKGICGVLL